MTAADHASTVRLALARGATFMESHGMTLDDSVYAALDALVAQAEAEEKRAIENGRLAQTHWERAEAAEAEVARWKAMCGFRRERQKQAEADNTRLREENAILKKDLERAILGARQYDRQVAVHRATLAADRTEENQT